MELSNKMKPAVAPTWDSWHLKKSQKPAVAATWNSWDKKPVAENPLCLVVQKTAAEVLPLIKG